jgi:hypothetical protein
MTMTTRFRSERLEKRLVVVITTQDEAGQVQGMNAIPLDEVTAVKFERYPDGDVRCAAWLRSRNQEEVELRDADAEAFLGWLREALGWMVG